MIEIVSFILNIFGGLSIGYFILKNKWRLKKCKFCNKRMLRAKDHISIEQGGKVVSIFHLGCYKGQDVI